LRCPPGGYDTRFGQRLDKLGHVRFRHWRLYGEQGLAQRQATIWLYKETLTIECADQPLAQYAVAYERAVAASGRSPIIACLRHGSSHHSCHSGISATLSGLQ